MFPAAVAGAVIIVGIMTIVVVICAMTCRRSSNPRPKSVHLLQYATRESQTEQAEVEIVSSKTEQEAVEIVSSKTEQAEVEIVSSETEQEAVEIATKIQPPSVTFADV